MSGLLMGWLRCCHRSLRNRLRLRQRLLNRLHRRYEPVSPPGHRLDKPRIVGRVAQRFAKLADGDAQGCVEIDESIALPEPLPNALPADNLARILQ